MLIESSKHEYLKRYLENEKDSDQNRKKKHKKKVQVSSLKIVDEDISLKSINFGDKVEEDEDDEKPVVAEIMDERPLEEKIKELYESSRWKKIDEYPVYTGPAAPPNRFGILPGYRWDGVERSNGFEKKYFEKVNKSKAVETEAYLWSVQDM